MFYIGVVDKILFKYRMVNSF